MPNADMQSLQPKSGTTHLYEYLRELHEAVEEENEAPVEKKKDFPCHTRSVDSTYYPAKEVNLQP